MTITHSRAADSTFTAEGQAAWEAAHTVANNTLVAAKLSATGNNLVFGRSTAGAGAGEEITFASLLTDRTLTRPTIANDTWANRTNYQTTDGNLLSVNDIGANGSLWWWDTATSLWYPLNGRVLLKSIGASVSGVVNSETIVLQTLLPVNFWPTNGTIRIWDALNKSGTTDTLTHNVRIGTAGTTADTAIVNATALTAANKTGGYVADIKLISATSVQRSGGSTNMTYSAPTSTAQPAAVTITSAALNALYVSVTIASSGATDTVGITSGFIEFLP